MRRALFPLVLALVTAAGPAYASGRSPHPARPRTSPVVTQADYVAARLARDPVFVTDQVPHEVTAADAVKIKAAIARMPVPTYVAVVPEIDAQSDPQGTPERLIALLHDRLGRDGVYIIAPAGGVDVEAQQYGGSLPVQDAAAELLYSEPYDAGVVRFIDRFVDNIRSGQARQRYAKAHQARFHGPASRSDVHDAVQNAGIYTGIAMAILATVLTAWRARRKRPIRGAARR